jgi:ABC-2 type transport system permease protein
MLAPEPWIAQAHAALVVAKKNARIYYLKPPVISFGIVFPVFFYLAFAVGRAVPIDAMVPGIVAVALFFTASAVGPLVTPWERQSKTYERLITSPASLEAILAGDTLAGLAFGVLLSAVPLGFGLGLHAGSVASPVDLFLGIALGAMAFSAMGVLLASPATAAPSDIMMLSTLVRLPLVFVSGIFVPIERMPEWGQWLARLSPLSYCADLIGHGFGGGFFPPSVDGLALAAFTAAFLLLARRFHRAARNNFS